jgi:hypothetical protein
MIMKKERARQLKQLVEEHKARCKSPNCGISVFLFWDLYKELNPDYKEEDFRSFI